MRTVLIIVEVLLLLLCLVLGVLWVLDPTGPFEPMVQLSAIILAVVDILRRYLRSARLRVFVSVGSTYTNAQELFVESFIKLLERSQCEVLMVGRDQQSALQPILQVRNLMRRSEAIVVLAFTRHLIKKAVERPGAQQEGASRKWSDARLPTVWNQIEAGIGFGLGRPMLVFVEDGLREEAMLKDRHEFRVIKQPLEPNPCDIEVVQARVRDFVRIARRRSWWKL